MDDIQVNIVNIDDLIIYKLLAGRARDVEDLKTLFHKKKGDLDLEALERTLEELSKLLDNDDILKNWNEVKKS